MKNKEYLFYSIDFNLLESDWNTENTYDKNYKEIPSSSGVYLIVGVNFYPFDRKIIYVGSSKNLKQRNNGHSVINKYKSNYDHIQFYFKECGNCLQFEIELIKKINPIYNFQHNINNKKLIQLKTLLILIIFRLILVS